MGQRGSKARPRALKVVEGDRPSRIPTDEPVPADAPPELPRGASDEVREVWDATVAELEGMGIAFRADADVLRCYCEAVVQHRRACDLLARTNVLVKGQSDRGGFVRNPALQVQRDCALLIRAFAHEFGLTPSARTQLGIDKDKTAMSATEALLS